MSTIDLLNYYVNLLIIQYASKPRATATIKTQVTPALLPQTSTQVISFSSLPTSGSYTLSWKDDTSSAIAFGANAAAVQTAIRTIAGLEEITVTGNAVDGFTVLFIGVDGIADLLEVAASTLNATISITETDEVLLLAIQNGFNLETAVGVQLDTIGKYVGAARRFQGLTGPITLSDDDYRQLIRVAVLTNNAQSDLASIQDFIFLFFSGTMQVIDYQDMRLSYLVSTNIGSSDFVQAFIAQNLIPRPMGVQVIGIIFVPSITKIFGFDTYELPSLPNNSPFNTYEDYDLDAPWLLYENVIN